MEQSGGSLWIRLLASIVAAHVIGAPLLAWLLRRRNAQGETRAGATVMRYPTVWRIPFLSVVVVAWGGIAYAMWAARARLATRPSDAVVLVALGAVLTVVVVAGILLVNGVAHEINSEGFLVVEPLRRRRMLRWTEVTEVYFDARRGWWRLRTPTDGIWIGQALSGLGAFARAILDRVPPSVIDARPSTRSQLESAATVAPLVEGVGHGTLIGREPPERREVS